MAVAVDELDAALDGAFDADLDGASSAELVDALERLERHRRRLAALDVRLLAHVRDRGVAAEHCRTSVADLLVSLLRVTPGEAKARVLAAEELGRRSTLTGETLEPVLPRVAAALAAGEVSAGHVAVIGRTLDRIPAETAYEVVPAAEQFLLDAARHEHPRRLEQTGRLLLTRLDPDGSEPSERNGRREFSLARHASGWSTVRGTLDIATTAALTAVLDSLAAPAPAADGAPDPRPAATRRHDALYEMTRRLLRSDELPAAGGVPVTVVVTATDGDRQAVTSRGEYVPLAELGGCSDPGCDADIVTVTATRTGAPLSLGRTRRLASPAQRLALAARDGGCCFPDCDRPAAWAEAHHVIAWQDGGTTDIDNLCLLCAFHHREHGRRGWSVRIADDGFPEWTPPPHLDPDRRPRRNRTHHDRAPNFAVPP